ncbi:MAG: peptidase S10 [Alphaproteobacteria bacterium]|nr:peptidase S10 [Alphaproteobacteria bacterium]
MKSAFAVAFATLLAWTSIALAADASGPFKTTEAKSTGSVTVGGQSISYQAVAGNLVVHSKGWSDTPSSEHADKTKNASAEASMFYVAYFRRGADLSRRPITFIFNGGPGSSSVWLHMGAFGPVRVVTADHTHTPAAPYQVIENHESLLDASDLVFVDAPGTGFSRIAGKDAAKKFYGVDQDIHAFAVFVRKFLSKYNRWNSPKFLIGESYGTMRGAGLPLALEREDIDLNGVALLSCILDWDLMPDNPELNPSVDLPYEVTLPSYATTAWYHHKLSPKFKHLKPLIQSVEHFAMTDYAMALQAGNSLSPERRQAIAERLSSYTGLPVAYLLRANLRIPYGAFQKALLEHRDLTTGTLDTRFTGPTMDPLSKLAQYDPQSAAISSAYVSAFNQYVRQTLHYKTNEIYKPEIPIYSSWDYKHQPPGASHPLIMLPNVLPDLAAAMKRNPDLKVFVNGGYFDLSTPFYEGWFETHHLQIPKSLQKNISYHYYRSGHMIYVHVPALKELHDNMAAFIRSASPHS